MSQDAASGQVVLAVKRFLSESGFQPGSRLPSERALAEQLGVSRPSLREALRALRSAGLLETRRGSGTVVSSSSARVLSLPFEYLVLFDRPTIIELYETRQVLEVYLAECAAQRRTCDDLDVLDRATSAMEASLGDHQAFVTHNMTFHMALAQAAHAPLAARIMDGLREAIRLVMDQSLESVVDWAKSAWIHREILESVRNQDANRAGQAMVQHMEMALDEIRRFTSSQD